jgi:hypothetical protein
VPRRAHRRTARRHAATHLPVTKIVTCSPVTSGCRPYARGDASSGRAAAGGKVARAGVPAVVARGDRRPSSIPWVTSKDGGTPRSTGITTAGGSQDRTDHLARAGQCLRHGTHQCHSTRRSQEWRNRPALPRSQARRVIPCDERRCSHAQVPAVLSSASAYLKDVG